MKKSCIFIPARIGSSRLPEKSIKIINGKSMIQRVIEKAKKSEVNDIILATDDERIAKIGKDLNVITVMTPSELPSGTDRSHYALKQLKNEYDYIINLQGDLPNIDSKLINQMNKSLIQDKLEMLTIAKKMDSEELKNNPSFVKIVLANINCQNEDLNKIYDVLYFSRSPIPHGTSIFYKHIGIYGYSKETLDKFVSLPQSPLEKLESLEQMRALENGIKIHAILTNEEPISIDTPQDLAYAIDKIHD